MRKVAIMLLLVVMPSLYAGAEKAPKPGKSKDKRFESVAVQVSGATGSYRGPAESYGLVLEIGDDGALRGNYVEMGHVAVLNAIVVDGAEFTASASFDDGSSRTITGSFVKRVLNGETTFGLKMRAVPVEDLGPVDTFFERF